MLKQFYKSIGLGPAGIGLGPAGIGFGPAGIGLGPAGIGLGPAGVGLGPAGVGFGPAGVGITKDHLSYHKTATATTDKIFDRRKKIKSMENYRTIKIFIRMLSRVLFKTFRYSGYVHTYLMGNCHYIPLIEKFLSFLLSLILRNF